MTFYGAIRAKNESRWLERVLLAMQPLCKEILVFDDHSTDDTAAIAERMGAIVFRSPFEGLDERRDKQWLLERAFEAIPQHDQHFTLGNADCPHWLVSLDGDEELLPESVELLRQAADSGRAHSYSVRILYAWDAENQIRVDGVYRNFRRPSMFRLMNRAFRYMSTPWGGNLHCSSIPQELIGGSAACDAAVLHYGYIDAALRRRKYDWYSQVDGNNPAEDYYRHLTQGDLGGWPASARLKHAGPLEIIPLT